MPTGREKLVSFGINIRPFAQRGVRLEIASEHPFEQDYRRQRSLFCHSSQFHSFVAEQSLIPDP